MKPMIPKRTRRLRARAATMNPQEAEFEDYGPEPNMKLSHAFLVVLLLHVIAVGGLYAFNSMKASKEVGKAAKLAAAKAAVPANPPTVKPGQEETKQQDSREREPKGEPPAAQKAPVVAKTTESTKAAPREGVRPQSGSLLQKVAAATGVGTAAATTKASAQVTNPEATVANPEPLAPKSYIVKAGDTITRIASSLGVAIPDLEKVNGIAGNAVLQVGQVLKVPEKAVTQAVASVSAQAGNAAAAVTGAGTATTGTPASMPAETTATGSPATAEFGEYTVAKGDSPYKIAKRFKISPEELMKINGITDPKKIQIGQKLRIPAAK
jgi:membrane-bound lytic murein transglycosylase D